MDKSRRLIIDAKGIGEKECLIFGYNNFSYEELLIILKKFKKIVESKKGDTNEVGSINSK